MIHNKYVIYFLSLFQILTAFIISHFYKSFFQYQASNFFSINSSNTHTNDDLIDIPMIPKDFRIFACSTYFSEAYMLYLRLYRLSPYVDKFLFLTADYTYSGKPIPPPSFYPLEKEINRFRHKIVFDKANFTGIPLSPDYSWVRENKQRNDLLVAVSKLLPNPEDIIIISDCDEIPLQNAMDHLLQVHPDFIKFVGYTSFYSFHWIHDSRWIGPFAIKAGAIHHSLQYYKDLDGPYLPGISLTHCSYCFPTLKQAIRKLQSFAHTEYSQYPYTDPSYLYSFAKCGKNLFTLAMMEENKMNISGWVPNDPQFSFLTQPQPFQDLELVNFSLSNSFHTC